MKKILTINIFLIIGLFFAVPAFAGDLTVDCSDSDCEMFPSENAALFDKDDNEGGYTLEDIKPGDTITRKITVNNNGGEVCYLQLLSAEITDQNPETFQDKLFTVFKDSGTTYFGSLDGSKASSDANLRDFFEYNFPLYLGSINPGDSKELDWIVTFDWWAGNEYQKAKLVFDFSLNFACGEQPERRVLTLTKGNNVFPQAQHAGNNVKFTLVVTNGVDTLKNVEVVDLPPEKFIYIPGTWTASSDVHGELTVPEPQYHSPATWYLGTMEPNEVITLTYMARIEDGTQDGLYKDLAWTNGEDVETDAYVLGNADTGIFVGTEVSVISDPDVPSASSDIETKTEEKGEVLGASSVLPATGADGKWVGLALGGLFFGLLLLGGGFFWSKKSAKTLAVIITLGIFGLLSSNAMAQSPSLSVRLYDPETPNSYDTLDISFVSLDIENRPITVDCYIKGPGDVAFTKYQSVDLAAGGDGGLCVADENDLADKGTYQFYVVANADADTATSQTVSSLHDSDTPGKPKYITKEKISSCEYRVEFKTANDSDTDTAYLYRDDDKELEADDGHKIKELDVGANQVVKYTDTKPDCDKTYYYGVRVLDDAGNISKLRVEELTKIVTTKDEGTTFTEILAVGASGSEAGTGGAVLVGEGESQVATPNEGESEESTDEGQVLGEEDTDIPEETSGVAGAVKSAVKSPIFWLLAVMGTIMGAYVWFNKRKNR